MVGLVKRALIALALLSVGVAQAQGIGSRRSAVLAARAIVITGPSPSFGAMSRTKDGSTGQTYTLVGAWTDVQWYRRQLAYPNLETPIVGATGATYVAQSGDENYLLVGRGKLNGVEAAAKAYGPVLPPPILLEGFDSITGWTTSGGAQIATVTDNVVHGTGRLQLTGTGTVSPQATKSLIWTGDTSTLGTIAFSVDVGLDAPKMTVQNFRVVLNRDGADQYVAGVTALATSWITVPLTMGKNWGAYNVSQVPGLASAGSGPVGLYVRQSGNIPYATVSKYDALLGRAGGRTTVILSFDDNAASQYSIAFPLMQARDIQGCFALTKNLVGLTGYMTLAQLQTLYAAGWDACLDSTHNDNQSISFGTMAAWEASFQQNRDYAVAVGMTRGNEHVIMTHGQTEYVDANGVPTPHYPKASVTFNGTNIATMASTASLAPGMTVAGYNIPDGITVVSVDSATQITMSGNVVAQVKPAQFVDTRGEFYTMKLPKRLLEIGVRSAWTVKASGPFFSRFGVGEGQRVYLSRTAVSDFSQAALQAQIDLAITQGSTVHFMFHSIGPAGGLETDVPKFTWLMDYLKAKRDAGLLDILTPSQWWARDGGASVPLSFNLALPRLPWPANDDALAAVRQAA